MKRVVKIETDCFDRDRFFEIEITEGIDGLFKLVSGMGNDEFGRGCYEDEAEIFFDLFDGFCLETEEEAIEKEWFCYEDSESRFRGAWVGNEIQPVDETDYVLSFWC